MDKIEFDHLCCLVSRANRNLSEVKRVRSAQKVLERVLMESTRNIIKEQADDYSTYMVKDALDSIRAIKEYREVEFS